MTEIKRVSPEEARQLLDEGYTFVDVRSEPEFEQGHVPGAYNVPLVRQGPAGMTPNPDFVHVMEAVFAKDSRLIVGCRSGARSLRAAQQLVGVGYRDVIDLRTGWEGTRDAFGRPEAGWVKLGLPVETGLPDERAYDEILRKHAP